MHISRHCDYYITPNTVSGVSRVREGLFGLQNIVIDVDCHDESLRIHEIDELIHRFLWRAERDYWSCGDLPYPNSIVRTGQGVHLWRALKPCHVSCIWYYNQIKAGFLEQLKAMVDEYSELDGLKVDAPASSNAVGYFRMPYTFHTKRKRKTATKILRTECYDLRELSVYASAQKASGTLFAASKGIAMEAGELDLLHNFYAAGARRIAKLIQLRNYRNNAAGSETRNNFCFAVYNELRRTFDHEEAMVRLRKFNAGFKVPMTENELQHTVCSAQRKGGYQYSNEKLIALLDITENEQAAISLFCMPPHRAFRKPNASRDEVRKARKEGRNAKILQLYETGFSQSEIARQLEINRKTVSRVLKEASCSEDTSIVETENNLPKNGSINDCLIGGSFVEWDEDDSLCVPEGQYGLVPDTAMPTNEPAGTRTKQTGSMIAFPRPGPS